MLLEKLKGQEAFKAMGRLVGCFREMFQTDSLIEIVQTKEKGWILKFFEVSLEDRSDLWLKMFTILNPDIPEEEVSVGSVITFAYQIYSDKQIMTLFFSQSEQTVKEPSGSPMENSGATEVTSIPS